MPGKTYPGESDEIDLQDFVTDEATGLEMYQFADKVQARLKRMGINPDGIERPELDEEHRGIFPDLEPGEYFDGRMPRVLKRLSLDQLSALSSLMNSWHQYVTSKRSVLGAEKAEATLQRRFILSLVRTQYKDSTDCSDKEAIESANQDYRFIQADAELAKIEEVYRTLDDFCALAKSNMAHLSRELTNVRTKLEQGYIGNVGRPPQRWSPPDEEEDEESPPPRRPAGKKGKPKGKPRIVGRRG